MLNRPVRAAAAILAAILVLCGAPPVRAGGDPARDVAGPPRARLSDPVGVTPTVAIDIGAWRAAAARGPFTVERFPLGPMTAADLSLERFRIAHSWTRFVVGRKGGADMPFEFDAERVLLLRGEVPGRPGSRVYLGLSDTVCNGFIDFGGGDRYAITSRAPGGGELPTGRLAVFPAGPGGASLPPGVPMCGMRFLPEPPPPPAPGEIHRGLRQLELAVETDYDYFHLFDDLDAAAAYVVELYGIISDIYTRDVNTRVDLSFVRLWETPDDLFSEGDDPLGDFRDYWNSEMTDVHRDVAQFLTGRRHLSAGGVAWVESLCSDYAYSWSGYTLGFFADPSVPSVYNRDIMIAAHELGHSCGTLHTHDYGLDSCQDETSNPQRGTIMSYCGQTYTGGDANTDLYFHAFCRTIMEEHITTRDCTARDCNGNAVADADDIAAGTSADANSNGVPDECEDCNGNGRLDPDDIALGFSGDLDADGVPDECEPDCNGNGVPDVLDFQPRPETPIFSDSFEADQGWAVGDGGATAGLWERGVPIDDPDWPYDPEADGDGNGWCFLTGNYPGNSDVDGGATRLVSPRIDMTGGGYALEYRYYLNMSGGSTGDSLTLQGNDNDGSGSWRTIAAHTSDGDLVWRTRTVTPEQIADAGLSQTAAMRFRFNAVDASPGSIVEAGVDGVRVFRTMPAVSADADADGVPDECQADCDHDGVYDFVRINADMSLDLNRDRTLDSCEDCDADGTTDLVELDHSNSVWVTALDQPTVRGYLWDLGTFSGAAPDAAILQGQDLVISPGRRVFVTSRDDNRVVEFTASGALVGDLVPSGSGGLSEPAAMALRGGGGGLLVVSRATASVIEFDSHGALVRELVSPGAGGLSGPFGIAFRPDHKAIVVTSDDNQVLEFDAETGQFLRVFVRKEDNGGLANPHGVLFLPSGNLLVASYGSDNILEFDSVSGAFVRQFSQVGTATRLTFDQPWCIRLGPDGGVYATRAHDHPGPGEALHLTNARIYHFDARTGYFVRAYIMGVDSGIDHPTGFDFVPDAGTDCNLNLKPDNCDIAAGRSLDHNENGRPDECECRADCNGDGRLNVNDFICFQAEWRARDPYGDFNGSGTYTVNDFISFHAAFARGCR